MGSTGRCGQLSNPENFHIIIVCLMTLILIMMLAVIISGDINDNWGIPNEMARGKILIIILILLLVTVIGIYLYAALSADYLIYRFIYIMILLNLILLSFIS